MNFYYFTERNISFDLINNCINYFTYFVKKFTSLSIYLGPYIWVHPDRFQSQLIWMIIVLLYICTELYLVSRSDTYWYLLCNLLIHKYWWKFWFKGGEHKEDSEGADTRLWWANGHSTSGLGLARSNGSGRRQDEEICQGQRNPRQQQQVLAVQMNRPLPVIIYLMWYCKYFLNVVYKCNSALFNINVL